jgi:hypothetical protein
MHIVREVEFGTAVRFLGFSLLLPCLLVTRERRACAPHHVNLFWLLLLAYRIVQTRRGGQALLCTACGVLALQQHLQLACGELGVIALNLSNLSSADCAAGKPHAVCEHQLGGGLVLLLCPCA